MAREILVKLWCDPCLAEDERVEGRELLPLWVPELQGRRPRVVTLCERHEKELYTPLVELLEEHGQPVDEEGNPTTKGRQLTPSAAPHDQPITCPECGHRSPNRGALGAHARTRHGKSIGQLLGLPTPYVCPEKGCGYESSRPQGLAAHRRQVHGTTGEQMRAERAAAEDADQPGLLGEEEEPARQPARARRKS